jgi:hypothetical protein
MSIVVALFLAYYITGGDQVMVVLMILGIVMGFLLEGKYIHVNRSFSFFR